MQVVNNQNTIKACVKHAPVYNTHPNVGCKMLNPHVPMYNTHPKYEEIFNQDFLEITDMYA